MAESLRNNVVSLVGEKACTKCKVMKLHSEFGKDKNSKNGMKSACLSCDRLDNAIRRKNPEYRATKYKKEKIRISQELIGRPYYYCNSCKQKIRREYFKLNPSDPTGINSDRCNFCFVEKKCNDCGDIKHISEFSRKTNLRPEHICKVCKNKKQNAMRSVNKKSKLSVRKRHLLVKYNLSFDAFEALHSSQGGKCAICRKEIHLLDKHTCVDHDHSTGSVRGILCKPCNSGIGQLKDDVKNLQSAIEYLNRSSGKT